VRRRLLAALFLLVGIVLLPLHAVAATIPTIIAYDVAVRSTGTTTLGKRDAVQPEAESARTGCDDATFAYDDSSNRPTAAGIRGILPYEDALNFGERREVGEGVIYAAPAATVAAEAGVTVTKEGLAAVTEHLAQFGEHAPNTAMLNRLAGQVGSAVTGADANFYTHELLEAGHMASGMSYDAAHAAALEQVGVSPFSLYHPEVIQQFPAEFNNAWRAFWGLQ